MQSMVHFIIYASQACFFYLKSRKQNVACPDDKTVRYMAREYSHSHYNMSLSREFEGITNGAFGMVFDLTFYYQNHACDPAMYLL